MSELTTEADKLKTAAFKNGYNFVIESDTELVFVRTNVPPLSRGGFFAGATLSSRMAKEIIERGVSKRLPVSYRE